jgi:uncharacterized protein YfaS (alpha-2-macroglobulin family)
VLDSIEKFIQTPCGCFEQTSSSVYPMIIALGLVIEIRNSVTDPAMQDKIAKWIERLQDQIAAGHKRLITFETSTHGYEWFG